MAQVDAGKARRRERSLFSVFQLLSTLFLSVCSFSFLLPFYVAFCVVDTQKSRLITLKVYFLLFYLQSTPNSRVLPQIHGACCVSNLTSSHFTIVKLLSSKIK